MSYSTPVKAQGSARRQVVSTPPLAPDVLTDEPETPVSICDGERTTRTEKIFREEDEIQLLNSVLKIAKSSSSTRVVKIDSTIFNLMGNSLGPKVFTRKQLSDKFRRLRIKYRKQAKSKSSIKTPRDRRLYEIGRMLWSKNSSTDDQLPVTEENGAAEDEKESSNRVDLRKYPFLMEEFEKSLEGNKGGAWREILEGGLEESKVREMNDRLVMLRYEEASVMAKKAKLVQELSVMILGAVTSPSSRKN